jgi:hypothetical protein
MNNGNKSMQQHPCGPTRAILKRKRYLPAAPENRSLAILYIALHSLPSSLNAYLAKRRVLRNLFSMTRFMTPIQ